MSSHAAPRLSGPSRAVAARAALGRAVARTRPDTIVAVALGLLLAAVALEGGGGLQLGPTTRVEIALELVGGALGATAVVATRGTRAWGGATLAAFAVFAGLTALSIWWAVNPDDAWLETNRTVAYLATFAAAVSLVRLAPQRWSGVIGATIIACAIVSGWALLTKVFPGALAPDETYARLREPFGYWNAVGLMAALGVPGCLWLGARRTGHAGLNALAYPVLGLLLVTILLAYSRGSLLAAAVGCAFWFAVVPLRLRGVAVLATSALGALLVSFWAFTQDGLTKDRMPVDLRATAGHELGLALVALVVALGAAGLAIGFQSARRSPGLRARRHAGLAILCALALVPVGLAVALSFSERGLGGSISNGWKELTDPNASTPANDPGRLTAVGSVRARYYNEALKIFKARPLYGAGAGGYATARTRFRNDDLDVRHAHGWLFQTLSDLGILGLVATLLLFAAWCVAVARTLALRPRLPRRGLPGYQDLPFGPERIGLLTLTTVVVVFGVHSFVDWTWFVPGTCVISLLCAGWVAGRGPQLAPALASEPVTAPLRARLAAGAHDRARLLLAAAIVGTALVGAWAAWQPLRAVNAGDDALQLVSEGKIPQARDAARRAHDIDPLSTEPLSDLAVIEQAAGDKQAGLAALQEAVRLQPQNPTAWTRLAGYQLDAMGDPRGALDALGAALYLDPRSQTGVTLFLDATRRLNGGAAPTATP